MNTPSPNQIPAHTLWIELATRITTQRLHYRSGDEESGARSVYSLFPKVRALLEKHPDAAEFREAAVRLLNETLRPYTARWHGWMTEDKERKDKDGNSVLRFRDEPARRQFRKELQDLQRDLAQVRADLARMAGILDRPSPERRSTANLGGSLTAGIGGQVPIQDGFDGALPAAAINAAEHPEILERRRVLGGHDKAEPRLINATGLAFSGGGIRSATFCLGIAQVLMRKGLLPQFDYLSTVSGGGYLGSFLSCALGTSRPGEPNAATREAANARLGDLFHRTSDESRSGAVESGLVRHIRNDSKYLLNGGAKTRIEIAGLLISGVLWNLLIMLPVPMVAVLAVIGLNKLSLWSGALEFKVSPWPGIAPPTTPAAYFLVASAITLAASWLLLPLIQLLTHGKPPRSPGAILRRNWEWVTLLAAVATVTAVLVYLVPALFHGYEWLRQKATGALGGLAGLWEWGGTMSVGAGSVILGMTGALLKSHWPRLRALAVKLFILSGPLFFLWTFLLIGNRMGLAAADAPWTWPWVGGVTAGVIVWGWCFVNINTLAPHRFYRSKLCECYLARRAAPGADETSAWVNRAMRSMAGETLQGRTESLQQVKLTELGACPAAPYHLVNTVVNLPASKDKNLRGRQGDFFLVSKHVCGAPTVGYIATPNVEELDPHFDLGTAMAVSGAAASTSMGWQSLPHFRFLMTLLNVRLGYWIRRPGARAARGVFEGPGPWYLFHELRGSMNENCRYLNLSDGGHIENLATYELLRRRCKFIVCVDAGHEPGMECGDLIRLQRYAEIDLGVRMYFDPSDLHLGSNGMSRAHAMLVKIDYQPDPASRDTEGRTSDQLGWMLYVKLALTGAEPAYVMDYKRQRREFPHEPTGDQLYDEAQFEAYRALGECAMESMFRDELLEGNTPRTVRDWFQSLANQLLPDNDEAFPRSGHRAVSALGLATSPSPDLTGPSPKIDA